MELFIYEIRTIWRARGSSLLCEDLAMTSIKISGSCYRNRIQLTDQGGLNYTGDRVGDDVYLITKLGVVSLHRIPNTNLNSAIKSPGALSKVRIM